MAFASQFQLYNKILPSWYNLSGVFERLKYYWLVSVSNQSVPRPAQGSIVTFCQGKAASSADRTGGAVFEVCPCSKCANICY